MKQFEVLLDEYNRYLMSKLRDEGVSDTIIGKVFYDNTSSGNSTGNYNTTKTLIKNNNQNCSNSYLGRNTDGNNHNNDNSYQGKNTDSTCGGNSFTQKEKYIRDYEKGEILIILHYSDKSHALFGDFDSIPKLINYISKNGNSYKENNGLQFGRGYSFTMNKLDELKMKFAEYNYKNRLIHKEAYIREFDNKYRLHNHSINSDRIGKHNNIDTGRVGKSNNIDTGRVGKSNNIDTGRVERSNNYNNEKSNNVEENERIGRSNNYNNEKSNNVEENERIETINNTSSFNLSSSNISKVEERDCSSSGSADSYDSNNSSSKAKILGQSSLITGKLLKSNSLLQKSGFSISTNSTDTCTTQKSYSIPNEIKDDESLLDDIKISTGIGLDYNLTKKESNELKYIEKNNITHCELNNKSTTDEIPPQKPNIKKNKNGNYEDSNTSFVFMKLPVGKKGAGVKVVIGCQEPETTKKGLDSVSPLNKNFELECDKLKYRYLTDEMMDLLKKNDVKIYEQLKEMKNRYSPDESDDSDTNETSISSEDEKGEID